VAPSGERIQRKGRHGVFSGKTVWSMPERFEIYIVYKRRYINTLPFLFLFKLWKVEVKVGEWYVNCFLLTTARRRRNVWCGIILGSSRINAYFTSRPSDSSISVIIYYYTSDHSADLKDTLFTSSNSFSSHTQKTKTSNSYTDYGHRNEKCSCICNSTLKFQMRFGLEWSRLNW